MEYGGTNGSVEDLAQFWKKEVEASAEWLKTQVFDLVNIYCRQDTILHIIYLRFFLQSLQSFLKAKH